VFQVRGADLPPGQTRTDFFRDWIDYENGFGSVQQDYWLGMAMRKEFKFKNYNICMVSY